MLFIIIIFIIYWFIIFCMLLSKPELRWDWEKIKISNMKFPDYFYWGTATASHQVEGNCNNNNWHNWENNQNEKKIFRIKDNQIAGLACDHWNKYQDDINLIKK